MNRLRNLKQVLPSVAIVLAICASGFAAPPLKLQASFDNTIPRFAALKVQITVQNTGTADVTIEDFPIPRLLRIELREQRAQTNLYQGSIEHSYRNEPEHYMPPVTLRPNEKRSFSVFLACGRTEGSKQGRVLFDKAGQYPIRFTYPISQRESEGRGVFELNSDWYVVSVVDVPPTDAPALARVASLPNPCWLFEPEAVHFEASSDEQQEWAAKLEALLRDYPKSYWTPFVHLSLAEHYERKARLPKGDLDEAMLTLAGKHLEVLEGLTDFPLAKRVDALKVSIQQASNRKQ